MNFNRRVVGFVIGTPGLRFRSRNVVLLSVVIIRADDSSRSTTIDENRSGIGAL